MTGSEILEFRTSTVIEISSIHVRDRRVGNSFDPPGGMVERGRGRGY